MTWPLSEKNAALKLIREAFLKQFVQPTLELIGSFEIDAIICFSLGSGNSEDQLVIKVHERLKNDHFDNVGIRNNGEPSLLREYLAGSTAIPKMKPNQPQITQVSRKRKAWDENDNAIYSPGKKILHDNSTVYPAVKIELGVELDTEEYPLNLSERCNDGREDRELRSGMAEKPAGHELNREWTCGVCLLKCNSYTALQDHFVDIHSFNLRFLCSVCNMGFNESEAHTKHSFKHSGKNQSASNRRKQTKPRKGIIGASDFSDDDIPKSSVTRWNEMHLAKDRDPLGMSGTDAADQSEGIVKSLLQKQSLSVAGLPQIGFHPKPIKHSTPRTSSRAVGGWDGNDSTSEFRCPHCSVLLDSLAMYSEHCKTVHKRFACPECLQTFTQRVNRDRHHYNHTGEKPYECDHCGIGFTRRDALKKHQVRANHLTTTSIDIAQAAQINCQEGSDDSANEDGILDAPVQMENLDNSEACEYLNACQNNDDIQGEPSEGHHFPHSSDRTPGSKFKPSHALSAGEPCGIGEDGELSDETSVNSFHSGDIGNPQVSDVSSQPLTIDSPKTDSSKLFKCDFCQEEVIGTAAYKEHCKVKHRRTPCIYCGKTFSQKGNMERHMRQHTGERPFQCQYCQSSYTRKETLKTHINQTHSFQVKQDYD